MYLLVLHHCQAVCFLFIELCLLPYSLFHCVPKSSYAHRNQCLFYLLSTYWNYYFKKITHALIFLSCENLFYFVYLASSSISAIQICDYQNASAIMFVIVSIFCSQLNYFLIIKVNQDLRNKVGNRVDLYSSNITTLKGP